MRNPCYPDKPLHLRPNDQVSSNENLYVQYSSSLSSTPSDCISNSDFNGEFSAPSCSYTVMPDAANLKSLSGVVATNIKASEYDVMPDKEFPIAPSKSGPISPQASPWPESIKVIKDTELSVGDLIGKGSFGIVRYGTWRGMAVALKSFRQHLLEGDDSDFSFECSELEKSKCWRDFQQEVKSMTLVCHHSNIVQLVGVVDSSSPISPCIVTVYYPNGSLYELLISPRKHAKKSSLPASHNKEELNGHSPSTQLVSRDNGLLYSSNLVRWALEAARGVFHLHQEGLIHRDLATRNLLLDDNFHVCVCDFGFSRVKEREASRGITKSCLGPIKWTSPEAMRHKSYSIPSDVFSFGVVLYEIFVQREPWASQDAIEVVLNVCAGERMTIPETVPSTIRKLMERCWDQDVSSRPDFVDIINTLQSIHDETDQLNR